MATQLLLREHALGDVLARPAITLEAAGRIEHRLAIDGEPACAAIVADTAIFERAKRLVRAIGTDVLLPIGRALVYACNLPASPTQRRTGRTTGHGTGFLRQEGEPELLVLLPVPVRGHFNERSKPRLASAQRGLRLFELRDVSRHRDDV